MIERTTLIAAAVLATTAFAAYGLAAAGDDSIDQVLGLPLPHLGLTDRGALGDWTVGAPVTVRWHQRLLAGAELLIEVSRDRGKSWQTIGRALAERSRFTWTVEGEWGDALLRLRTSDGRTTSNRRRITLVAPVRQIVSKVDFGLALHEDGRVRAWGQLPTEDFTRTALRPTIVEGFSNIVSIAGGDAHCVAIDADGAAWIWGDPDGRANPEQGTFRIPTKIEGIERAVFAEMKGARTFIGVADGRVFGMGGFSRTGVMGDGVDVPPDVPFEVPSLRDVIAIRVGWSHAIALRPDGTVVSWGTNGGGELGDDSAPQGRTYPGPVPGLDDVVAIDAEIGTSMALKRDGTVWVWGGAQGLLGASVSTIHPFQVLGLERVREIGCGDSIGFALQEDGVVMGWANFGTKFLGVKESFDPTPPIALKLPPIEHMFIGLGPGQVIATTGGRLAWGAFTGDGTTKIRWAPVPIYSR